VLGVRAPRPSQCMCSGAGPWQGRMAWLDAGDRPQEYECPARRRVAARQAALRVRHPVLNEDWPPEYDAETLFLDPGTGTGALVRGWGPLHWSRVWTST